MTFGSTSSSNLASTVEKVKIDVPPSLNAWLYRIVVLKSSSYGAMLDGLKFWWLIGWLTPEKAFSLGQITKMTLCSFNFGLIRFRLTVSYVGPKHQSPKCRIKNGEKLYRRIYGVYVIKR